MTPLTTTDRRDATVVVDRGRAAVEINAGVHPPVAAVDPAGLVYVEGARPVVFVSTAIPACRRLEVNAEAEITVRAGRRNPVTAAVLVLKEQLGIPAFVVSPAALKVSAVGDRVNLNRPAGELQNVSCARRVGR